MSESDLAVLHRLIERLGRLQASAAEDLAWLGAAPRDLIEFDTMAPHRRSASRAVLKSFEQTQDQLSRAFRLVPSLLGVDAQQWFARDHADFMEKLTVLDDAADWSRVVKLRNQLVHDYPLDAQVQFDRLIEVIGLMPFLANTHERLVAFARDDLPSRMI